MKFEIVKNILDGIPHTPPEDGLLLYNFILKSKPSKILELGFQHGVSTLYMAAALDEIGFGEIITIDRQSALHENPSIETLLNKSGLNQYVKAIYANYSYTWELMKIIRDNSTNQNEQILFDFCFIDGAHNWETDGFSFFLVDKLLNDGAFILFDDVYWTYSKSEGLKNTDFVKQMSIDEKNTPQVELILKLLVAQRENYSILSVNERWAWVQKIDNRKKIIQSDFESLFIQTSIKSDIKKLLKKIKSKLTK